MNILFITIGRINGIESHGIYPDLLRQLRDAGHNIYITSPNERRTKKKTCLIQDNGAWHLYIKTGNVTKCSTLEKGISTIFLNHHFKKAFKRYLNGIKFDLILYSTPPITFTGLISYLKKRDNAKTYLLLKDIFPQNAVDLGMMTKNGVKGLIYRYFRRKEKKLYEISDYIGCMSPANVDFVLKNNSYIDASKVEIFPNCIEPVDMSISDEERIQFRERYGIPLDKKVFVYGGNLGKPQGIDFLIKCLRLQMENKDAYFLIVGDGTEYTKLSDFVDTEKPSNIKLMQRMPKDEYDKMIAACDVGMIFLDYKFTIPNFPSRLLAYMQARLPVLACTDECSDVGNVIVENDFGWFCRSNSTEEFNNTIEKIIKSDISVLGNNAYNCLLENYDVKNNYEKIVNKF